VLPGAFYARPADTVARDLLGAILVSTVDGAECVGRIVETEAYTGPHDEASHAAARIGRTLRNAAMFGPPGIAYVYRIYGIHWCLNAVTDAEGFPAAVLIRSLQPLHGLEVMRERRFSSHAEVPDTRLCSGPGRLAQAMGITGALNFHPLQEAPLVICRGQPVADADVQVGPRIGITRAVELPLRFHLAERRWRSR
jgi:DNA-3-methyladenine glycosylase